MAELFQRHIQNASEALYQIEYWGYASRSFPCTNDAGSCEYLDGVYWMHTVSMLYTFIMWAVFGGIVLGLVALRILRPSRKNGVKWLETEGQRVVSREGLWARIWGTVSAFNRRWLLPEALPSIFGHVTRLQILTLLSLLVYLAIFSFVSIVYQTWITPVKNTSPQLYNTRTGLGGFSDRIGAIAYALTPLTIALSTRENMLTLLTGIPYQHFMFLHVWTGRIIYIQGMLHTVAWTLVEGKFYQPQPSVWNTFIKEDYIIWGVVAMVLLSLLFFGSFKAVIRLSGHEIFRKTHYIFAAVYMGACWKHWDKLACWMYPGIALLLIDRVLRLFRSGLMHIGYLKDGTFGFVPASATLHSFDGPDGSQVLRLEFSHNHAPFLPAQHFFLCFPALSVWQSHPFTVASLPSPHPQLQKHVYIVRCLSGETKKLGALARALENGQTTPVIMTGPYGERVVEEGVSNVLAIAGGTGISFTLPLVTDILARGAAVAVQLVWVVRNITDLAWIETELKGLKEEAKRCSSPLTIKIFVTRETAHNSTLTRSPESDSINEISKGEDLGPNVTTISVCSSSSLSNEKVSLSPAFLSAQRGFEIQYLGNSHPSVENIVRDYLADGFAGLEVEGKVQVVASGLSGMGRDLRAAVAQVNDPAKAWKGTGRAGDVGFYWDDRMG